MKKILLLIGCLAVLSSIKVSAQELAGKFGHIDMTALIQSMPESQSIQTKMQAKQTELEETYQQMQTEVEQKQQDYQQNSATWTDSYKQQKELEFQNLLQRVQQFNTDAQQQIIALREELMKPILDKAHVAIEAIAKEKKLIYVFSIDEQLPIILYKSPQSMDLLPLVQKKLGIVQ